MGRGRPDGVVGVQGALLAERLDWVLWEQPARGTGCSSAAGSRAWAGRQQRGSGRKAGWMHREPARGCQFGAWGENDASGPLFPFCGHRMSHQDLRKNPLLWDTGRLLSKQTRAGEVAGQDLPSAKGLGARASPAGSGESGHAS